MIPYMYAYERNAYEKGVGLVRPLIFDYPFDSNVENYTDAWMFGDWILSAPVVERNQSLKSIYLPSGTWIDYNTGMAYSGGQTIQYPVDAETWTDMPMFIKKGAIIPSQKVLDYIEESSLSTVFVDVFPDTKAFVNTNHSNYSGSGFVDGFDHEGAAVTFYTKVKVGGDYDVSLCYANASGAAQSVSIFVNGSSGTILHVDDVRLIKID